MTRVDFFVNGALLCSDTTPAYSCVWSVPRKRGGAYVIQVQAQDAAGNRASQSLNVTAK